jgi:fatty-acyl-CoA synthase
VAVIGVPDEKWGESVLALVVLRPDAVLDDGELAALVKARKGSLHAPKRIVFVNTLPQTPLGKIDKKAIRASYWSGQPRSVG